jgi:glycine/D-amino acid oxidase-like deaminating enzyme
MWVCGRDERRSWTGRLIFVTRRCYAGSFGGASTANFLKPKSSHWSGLYTVSPDAHPILGTVSGLDGYYHAVGFSGHGFMLAPIVGKLVAELICGRRPSIDIDGLDLSRFARGDYRIEPAVV